MNKKDIANIRKQFKMNNDLLRITDMFNVYVMKESSDIFHYQSQPFGMLDQDQQELFLHNFKKLLAGRELTYDHSLKNQYLNIYYKI